MHGTENDIEIGIEIWNEEKCDNWANIRS